ncbi:C-factor, partial [Stegodyphus mimosarum]
MESRSVFVTGANRGIGLEFIRQLVALPKAPRYVFATYRSKDSLQALIDIKDSSKYSEVILIRMDVSKPEEVKVARAIVEDTVGDDGLNLLINNAGICQVQAFPNVSTENLLQHFTTNTVGPVMVLQELYPSLLKAASRQDANSGMGVNRAMVLNISSLAGSITRTGKEFVRDIVASGYKISKAALNMAMRVFAANVKDQGILIVMMCPGWVKTDMGTDQGQIEVEESISTMLQTLPKLNEKHHGVYMDRSGNEYPF